MPKRNNVTFPDKRHFLWVLLIIAAAVVVRGICLYELKNNSYLGNIRVSDSKSYHQFALSLLRGTAEAEKPFWQAPLYYYILLFLYLLAGDALLPLQIFHILIGISNGFLLYRLASFSFGRINGLLSMLIAACYLPFVLFDVQAIHTNIVTFFILSALLFLYRFMKTGGKEGLVPLSSLLGLSIITHGLAIFSLPAIVFVLWGWQRTGVERKKVYSPATVIFIFLLFSALPPAVVSIRNTIAEKAPVFISTNAGINLYVGSPPNFQEKYNIRNGVGWQAFRLQAVAAGALKSGEQNQFFMAKAIQGYRDYPILALKNMLKKIAILLSGDETSRNFPIGPMRKHSHLIAALLWEATISERPFLFFPTGILVPLCIAGFLLAFLSLRSGRKWWHPQLVTGWVAFSYALGLIVFFPCTRYRLLFLYLLVPYAAYFLLAIVKASRSEETISAMKNRRALAAAVILFIGFFFFSNFWGPRYALREPQKEMAEHYLFQGAWKVLSGRSQNDPERTESGYRLYERAAETDPEFLQALHNIGYVYLNHRKMPERANFYFNEVIKRLPADSPLIPVYLEFMEGFR